jgi:hypothetical protein
VETFPVFLVVRNCDEQRQYIATSMQPIDGVTLSEGPYRYRRHRRRVRHMTRALPATSAVNAFDLDGARTAARQAAAVPLRRVLQHGGIAIFQETFPTGSQEFA